ncbi:unnamed protein product, partial [Meganyctiphanes norvegica]
VTGGEQHIVELVESEGGTKTITERLNIRLTEHHLNSGTVNLTCGARVGRHYWTTNTIAFSNARLRKVSQVSFRSSQNEVHPIPASNQKSIIRSEVVPVVNQLETFDSGTTT